MQTGSATRGRSLFAAHLTIVLASGLITSIGWAQNDTPDIAKLDEICSTDERTLCGLAGPSPILGRLSLVTLLRRFLST